ncbi:helix-turn-helix domain-containing protein [Acerihabitans arboris]|uniref:Helix-turn-helix domain-containing protein n=1 Tax=Acerihabitans arboris TaxID=2691583 RepID=A0A845SEX5_9GAMM|nr:AraC family transcriptional regulator [Acerihabitans arboris]NDL61962.1 helix-turn-helix domain-containing protein [Acerihabitans arboris]
MTNHKSRIILDKSLIAEGITSKVDRWRSGVNAALLESNFSRTQAEHLTWSVEAHHFDVFICGRLKSTGQSLINLPHKYDNLNDHFILMSVVEGGIEGKAGYVNIELSAGDIILLDVLQPINMKMRESRNSNYIDVLYVAIPRALLSDIDNCCQLHGKIIPQKDFLSRMIATNITALMSHSANFSHAEVNQVARPIIDFVISAIRSTHAPIQPIMMDTKLHIITRICDFIQEHLRVPALGAELICQKFGLSRSSLYRLFEPFGGIVAHIRKKRIVAATRMLLKPQYQPWKVAEIAYYWQFEPAAFNRLFFSAYGITPNQARKEHHELWALENMNESQVVWLRSL